MFGLGHKKGHYVNDGMFRYYSPRYDKWVTVPDGFSSDGATGAFDVGYKAWMVHDALCDYGIWDDNELCYNWQASRVISDILREEGRYIRTYTWLIATFLFGGGQARINGMFIPKEKAA